MIIPIIGRSPKREKLFFSSVARPIAAQVCAKEISQANRRIAANGFQVHEEQCFPRARHSRQALQRFRRKVRLHSRSFEILNFFKKCLTNFRKSDNIVIRYQLIL